MKALFDRIMERRARKLTERLKGWIPPGCRVADIGSGTGHNARAWTTELGVTVDEFDVSDLHWVGAGPVIFDGQTLPAADAYYSLVTLLFVLQYSSQPADLLREAGRIGSNRILVIQSTYDGVWGRAWLNIRAFLWGPVAFYLARLTGIIRGQSCPLIARTLYTREELTRLFQQAGLTVIDSKPPPWREWWGLPVRRDLYVLEVTPRTAICPSSFPPAMKNAG